MIEPIANLDDFVRDGWRGDAPPPFRVILGRDAAPPPAGSLQVQFARLELVLGGVYRNALCDGAGRVTERELRPGDALFVPANSWNRPAWDADVRLLSMLFGAKHFGLSLLAWDAARGVFDPVEKHSCPLPGNSPLYHMIAALSALDDDEAARQDYPLLLTRAVIDCARKLITGATVAEERRAAALHRAACIYIEENLGAATTRERVARQFDVSPNYLSRVFRDQGGTTFLDFLTLARIGTARRMLEKYDMPLAEIARHSGFRDVNYFLKVFKKRLGRTPSEYRTSIRSKTDAANSAADAFAETETAT